MKTSGRASASRKVCRRPAGEWASTVSAPLVRILWRDAYVLTEGWASRYDTSRPGDDECLVWSVGFLIGEDEAYYRLARDAIVDVKNETVGGVLSIPRAFVVRIDRLDRRGRRSPA